MAFALANPIKSEKQSNPALGWEFAFLAQTVLKIRFKKVRCRQTIDFLAVRKEY